MTEPSILILQFRQRFCGSVFPKQKAKWKCQLARMSRHSVIIHTCGCKWHFGNFHCRTCSKMFNATGRGASTFKQSNKIGMKHADINHKDQRQNLYTCMHETTCISLHTILFPYLGGSTVLPKGPQDEGSSKKLSAPSAWYRTSSDSKSLHPCARCYNLNDIIALEFSMPPSQTLASSAVFNAAESSDAVFFASPKSIMVFSLKKTGFSRSA